MEQVKSNQEVGVHPNEKLKLFMQRAIVMRDEDSDQINVYIGHDVLHKVKLDPSKVGAEGFINKSVKRKVYKEFQLTGSGVPFDQWLENNLHQYWS